MKLITSLVSLVRCMLPSESQRATAATTTSAANERWLSGYEAFQQGRLILENLGRGKEEQHANLWRALPLFDEAIDNGVEDVVFEFRGMCLQGLEFHIDAIDDFDKAIAVDPSDSNLWFMRSNSRGAVGDCDGEVSDLLNAISIAESGTGTGMKSYNDYAAEQGYVDVAGFYKHKLQFAKSELEQRDRMARFNREHPELKQPDMASRLRAKAKRRPHR